MKQIHLIGDSHALMYNGLIPVVQPHHFGACTAYSLLDPDSATHSWQTFRTFVMDNRPSDNMLMLLFGEIDCRVLIYYKHVKHHSVGLSDMVDIVCYRYLGFIDYLRDIGYDILLHGPIPAVRQGNEYNVEFYGPDNIRAAINIEFNLRLKEISTNHKIKYYDIFNYPLMLDKDGMVPINSLLPDKVHVDPEKVQVCTYLRDWLRDSNLIPQEKVEPWP